MAIAIHIPNKESFFRVSKFLELKFNVRWSIGRDHMWETVKNTPELCITKDFSSSLSYCYTSWFIDSGYTLMSEEDYIEHVGITTFKLENISPLTNNLFMAKHIDKFIFCIYENIILPGCDITCRGCLVNNKLYIYNIILDIN